MTHPTPPDRQHHRRRLRLLGLGVVVVLATGITAGIGAAVWLRGSDENSDGLNISCFVYRDVNRNAVYDIADRPYAGLRVEVEGPDEDSWTNSNISGFANFPMRLGDDGLPIDRAGEYDFHAIPPNGYSITSDTGDQELQFSELEGSPVGIVAATTCVPIGVAPNLTIFGSVGSGIEARSGEIDVASTGRTAEVDVFDEDNFRASVAAGTWTIDIADSGTEPRTIEVVNHPVFVSAPSGDRDSRSALGIEVTVDFDELTPSDTLYEMPSGVAGLNWRNWVATHHKLYSGAGYVNATTSSEYVGYNSSGHPAVVWSEEPFDFVGTHLGVAWPDAENFDIVLRGYLDEALVYEDRVRASTAGAIFIDAEYRGITRLEMSSDANWQFVADDMRFRLPQ